MFGTEIFFIKPGFFFVKSNEFYLFTIFVTKLVDLKINKKVSNSYMCNICHNLICAVKLSVENGMTLDNDDDDTISMNFRVLMKIHLHVPYLRQLPKSLWPAVLVYVIRKNDNWTSITVTEELERWRH